MAKKVVETENYNVHGVIHEHVEERDPEIAEKVWDITFDTGTNVVDVYINILRKKIDKDFQNKLIQTRIGLGYSIDEP